MIKKGDLNRAVETTKSFVKTKIVAENIIKTFRNVNF
jgi:hypothetical protein